MLKPNRGSNSRTDSNGMTVYKNFHQHNDESSTDIKRTIRNNKTRDRIQGENSNCDRLQGKMTAG